MCTICVCTRQACECSTALVKSLSQWKRRTISPFAARVYFYYSRAHELVGALESIRPYVPESEMLCSSF
jgi:hypothetical protein